MKEHITPEVGDVWKHNNDGFVFCITYIENELYKWAHTIWQVALRIKYTTAAFSRIATPISAKVKQTSMIYLRRRMKND